MKDIFDNPTLRALRALDESPTMKAIRALEDSPAIKVMRDMENSSVMQAMRQIEESPVMRMMRDLETSPALKAIQEFEQSPALKAIRQLQDSPVMKAIEALERSPAMEAFSTVAARLSKGYGVLTFNEAYELLLAEYEEQVAEDASESLDELAKSVDDRVSHGPFGPLSAEFYLNLIFALILLYLSQISAEQSEVRLLTRMDEMEQTISLQLAALKTSDHTKTFLVADRSVNLRKGPSTDHEVINVLFRNQKVLQLEKNGDWSKVEYFDYVANELKHGWVHNRYFIAVIGEHG